MNVMKTSRTNPQRLSEATYLGNVNAQGEEMALQREMVFDNLTALLVLDNGTVQQLNSPIVKSVPTPKEHLPVQTKATDERTVEARDLYLNPMCHVSRNVGLGGMAGSRCSVVLKLTIPPFLRIMAKDDVIVIVAVYLFLKARRR